MHKYSLKLAFREYYPNILATRSKKENEKEHQIHYKNMIEFSILVLLHDLQKFKDKHLL
jgi:hypothetical protein